MIDLEELHRALAKLREKYLEDVSTIAQFMLKKRSEQQYRSVDHAEEDLDWMVQQTFWMEDNHSAIVLYLSSNRDIADSCIAARDIDRDDFITQRAHYAMAADICKFLWGQGWTSIGEQYRSYTLDKDLNEAIKSVIDFGLRVCDMHEADKSENKNMEEAKLLNAIQHLQFVSSK